MRALLGMGVLTATTVVWWLLLPRNGKERWLVRLPGMWIVLGLLLTISATTGIALVLTGTGLLH
jgi:hypothetical protein